MKVFVNDRNEICAVNSTDNPNLTPLEILDEDNPFVGWSEAKICCYKVNVSEGVVTMMTPYVDSRLIEHIDQLGKHTETNSSDISDTQDYIDVIMTEVIPSLMGMDDDMELDEEE